MKTRNKVMLVMGIFLLIFLVGCSKTSPTGNTVAASSNEPQVVMLGLDRGGFLPRVITVKANKPVTLKNDGSLGGCGLYPIQPEIGMNANFGKSDEYTFTPTKKGTFTFTCNMGMFKGTIKVV